MKKRALCSFGAYILAIQTVCCNILPCYAAETGLGTYSAAGTGSESYPSTAGIRTEDGDPAAETGSDRSVSTGEKYVLEADRQQISFGSLEQGSLAPGQDIVLTNRGTEDIRLSWHEADYYDCIVVDAPDLDYLSPGESCTFTVEADTSLEPGTYSTFLLFGDVEDIYYVGGVQVNISLEIRKPVPAAPVITAVSISPGTTVAAKNTTCTFTASVSGENDYSREVAWSVSGQTSRNTFIEGNGTLHIGADEAAYSLVVKAVSMQDSRYSATALVSLQKSSYFIQVKASPDHGGSVYGSGIVEEGGHTVISAAPNNGFFFDGWTSDNNRVSSNSQYVVENVRSDKVFVANFKPVSCRVSIMINNSNAGTVTESRTVGYGESMTLEAIAKEGYRFDSWTEDGKIISTDSRMQLHNITEPRSITAMFSQYKCKLSLACSPADMGGVSGQGVYDKGSNVKITAVPIQGCKFTGWVENGGIVSTEKEYVINALSRDRYLVAHFEKEQVRYYTIGAAVSSSNGTITPGGNSKVAEGAGLLYAITPRSGYVIQDVYVDGKSVGAVSSYRFTDVRAEHTISADFKAIPVPDRSDAAAAGTGKTDGKNETGTDTAETDGTDMPEKGQEEPDGQLQASEMSRLTGTLQYLNISVEDAARMIDTKDDQELMTGALQTGDLQVTIHNDFAVDVQETSSSSFYENSTVTNFETVLDHILTKEEKIEMLLGNSPVALNLHINNVGEDVSRLTVRSFEEKKLPTMKIGRYFDMFLMESRQGDTQMISELPEALNVVINVPDDLRADNRDFYILRLHTKEDDSMEYAELVDEDDDPDTISFSTDRFSSYAIAYIDWDADENGLTEKTADSKKVVNVIIITFVIAVAAMVLFTLLYGANRKKH